MTSQRSALTIGLGVAALVVLVDQLTKTWAVNHLRDRNIHLLWTLQLNLTFNSGMAFGRGRGLGPVIAVVGVCLVAGLVLGTSRAPTKVAAVAGGLVVGGAISNLLDRIFREGSGFLGGQVVDFIDPQHFPVFNLADAAIDIGGLLLVIVYLRTPAQTPLDSP